jgi:hypothetical protein
LSSETVVAIDAENESSSDEDSVDPRHGGKMAEHQHQAGSRHAPRRIAAANENGAALRHGTHAKTLAGRKESPLTSFKNQSVIRAFAILKSFYYPDEWVAACELSRRAKIHEATVNRFMQSLVDVGAVVRDEDGKYRCVLFVMPGTHGGPFVQGRVRDKSQPRLLSR